MSERDTQLRLNKAENELDKLRQRLDRTWHRPPGGGGGLSLPKGKGKYKVLMLIDDLDPATPDWDHIRFDSGE